MLKAGFNIGGRVAHDTNKSLGEVIREARNKKAFSLRALAKKLDKTFPYLSDIENDHRIPSEDMLQDLARLLDLDFDDLMARAGRLGEGVMRYMRKTPAAGVLFRKICSYNLQGEQLEQLAAQVDKLVKRRTEGR
jgi:transcriptional regulator with XRE-family HTH domain